MKAAQPLLVVITLFVSSLASGQDWKDFRPEGEYSFNQVKDAVRRVTTTGAYTGWDDKAFSRSGDMVAVAVLQTLDDEDMASRQGARNVLVILRMAFGCPSYCVKTIDE